MVNGLHLYSIFLTLSRFCKALTIYTDCLQNEPNLLSQWFSTKLAVKPNFLTVKLENIQQLDSKIVFLFFQFQVKKKKFGQSCQKIVLWVISTCRVIVSSVTLEIQIVTIKLLVNRVATVMSLFVFSKAIYTWMHLCKQQRWHKQPDRWVEWCLPVFKIPSRQRRCRISGMCIIQSSFSLSFILYYSGSLQWIVMSWIRSVLHLHPWRCIKVERNVQLCQTFFPLCSLPELMSRRD